MLFSSIKYDQKLAKVFIFHDLIVQEKLSKDMRIFNIETPKNFDFFKYYFDFFRHINCNLTKYESKL